MALLCFLLDLRNISPPLLRHLKQCLLQLANLYAASSDRRRRGEAVPFLPDRLALCYIDRMRPPSSSPEVAKMPRTLCAQYNVGCCVSLFKVDVIEMWLLEKNWKDKMLFIGRQLSSVVRDVCWKLQLKLKIAYRPGEKFNLRDFHHAVNNLPLDSFLSEISEVMHTGNNGKDASLANLFSNKALYSWATDDVSKKVLAICMCACNAEVMRRSLMDAAEQCVTVEFVMMETEAADTYDDFSENDGSFVNKICDLENCVIRRYNPDTSELHRLVKRCLEELKDDMEEPLQAAFVFKDSIVSSVDQICCNLYATTNQITDGFTSCQTCRCHGQPIDLAVTNRKKCLCPITSKELAASDLIENAVKIGEQAVLFLPSSEGGPNPRQISDSLSFNVIERTALASLNEGVITGTSFIVTPSSHDTETALTDESTNQNIHIFYGLCEALFKLDQGLICSSTCNTETMNSGTLQCYYVLQPSEKGPMLLRRLAASEEILPLPDMTQTSNSYIPKELKDSIGASLSKIALKDYNPLPHERGFHSKLNSLVKESLQFGSIAPACVRSPKPKDPDHLSSSIQLQPSLSQAPTKSKFPNKSKEKAPFSVTEEWEQLLIVDEMTNSFSSPCTSKVVKPQSSKVPSPPKPLDEKTSRILERLEAPKPKKQKASKPSTPPVVPTNTASTQMKKPLLPFEPSESQPMKPSFSRLRKKLST